MVTWCNHVTLTKFTTERGERDMDRCVMRGWCGRGRQFGAVTRDIDKVHDRARGREMDRCVMRGWCGEGGNLVPLRDIDKVHDRARGREMDRCVMRGWCGEGGNLVQSHVTLTKFTRERGREMDQHLEPGSTGGQLHGKWGTQSSHWPSHPAQGQPGPGQRHSSHGPGVSIPSWRPVASGVRRVGQG